MKDQPLYIEGVIGSYRLLHFVGLGPASHVYLAECENDSSRRVVLKLLDTELLYPLHQQQFLQEASRISRLKDRSLLPFLSAGMYGKLPYVVRPYVEAGSLQHYLRHTPARRFPVDWVLCILQQVGKALLVAHQQQIVHANLKPGNLLLLDEKRVALTDFRLHTLTKTLRTARLRSITAACYMAPEQFQGSTTPLSDQYAFACLAYELLTGQPPFTAADFSTLARKHALEPPLPPSLHNATLPLWLDQVILKSLAKWPDERYADMQALLSALSGPPPVLPITSARLIALPQLSQMQSKRAISPSGVQAQAKREGIQTQPTKSAQKPPAVASSHDKPSLSERMHQATSRLFALLFKMGETALLMGLVFLFECFRACGELLSLGKLFFSVVLQKFVSPSK